MQRKLGVNVDHVATIRQARGTRYPDPVFAASLAELAGAHQITVHLREDRRHIQDEDLRILRRTVQTELNLEMGAAEEILAVALEVRPDTVTLVPERREELTTEGGLDVAGLRLALRPTVGRLVDAGIRVSMFIEPDLRQVRAARELGAQAVELHTGRFCELWRGPRGEEELVRLEEASRLAADLELHVAAGHGLDYTNIDPVAGIEDIAEFNIGHSIVARSILVGMEAAVREMLERIAW
ncbi:MAG: pyridoxine 5'-phosphate synthase [Deltaproteobacteria bacterium]|nr:pyridoxine 5'-phosphate synthase [Deltaproteobacteria bacterium]